MGSVPPGVWQGHCSMASRWDRSSSRSNRSASRYPCAARIQRALLLDVILVELIPCEQRSHRGAFAEWGHSAGPSTMVHSLQAIRRSRRLAHGGIQPQSSASGSPTQKKLREPSARTASSGLACVAKRQFWSKRPSMRPLGNPAVTDAEGGPIERTLQRQGEGLPSTATAAAAKPEKEGKME